MTKYETLLYEILDDGVLKITLNRPEVFNAFNEQMKKDFLLALKSAEMDSSTRTIVIQGSGKAFCSGQDLKENQREKRNLKESLEKSYNPIVKKIHTIEKPIIAMINGVAAGAGLSIALACDMRTMSNNAKLIEVFIRIALIPDSGSHYFLPRLVGMGKSFEYMATGRDIDSLEAEKFGIVNHVFEENILEEKTLELASQLAKLPTKTIGLIKRSLNKSLSSTLDEVLNYEAINQQIASQTDDYKEGVNAFIEKRKAIFKGK